MAQAASELGETFDHLVLAFGPRGELVIVSSQAPEIRMSALLLSTAVVALAEIGDKTQLLALTLTLRFRKPLPIALAIVVATLANHALAGAAGRFAAAAVAPDTMRWIIGCGFLVMAGWTLIPDKADDVDKSSTRLGAFLTTLVAFFLLEMGDKTQAATVALAAQYASLVAVVAGSTAGMLLANLPIVLLGSAAADGLPLRAIRTVAALTFFVLGIVVLAEPWLGRMSWPA